MFRRTVISVLAALMAVCGVMQVSPARADGSCPVPGVKSETIIVELSMESAFAALLKEVVVLTDLQREKALDTLGIRAQIPEGIVVSRIGYILWADGSANVFVTRDDTCIIGIIDIRAGGMPKFLKEVGTTTKA